VHVHVPVQYVSGASANRSHARSLAETTHTSKSDTERKRARSFALQRERTRTEQKETAARVLVLEASNRNHERVTMCDAADLGMDSKETDSCPPVKHLHKVRRRESGVVGCSRGPADRS
jgi:hypothetical protein